VIYTVSLAEKSPFTGAYVAQAVFQPRELPPLKPAKGRAWFLDHSPEDETCPFKDAEAARDALTKAGAKVELVTYEGGHGWNGDLFGRMKQGIKFLEDHVAAKK
jgi:predicted esterase